MYYLSPIQDPTFPGGKSFQKSVLKNPYETRMGSALKRTAKPHSKGRNSLSSGTEKIGPPLNLPLKRGLKT